MSRGRRQRRAGRGRATVHAEPGTTEPVGRRALWGAGVPGTPELPLEPTGPPRYGGVARHPGQMGRGRAQGCAATLLAQGRQFQGPRRSLWPQELRNSEGSWWTGRHAGCVGGGRSPHSRPLARLSASSKPRVPSFAQAEVGTRGPPGSSDAACSGWWRWGEGRSDSRCVVKVAFLTGQLWGVRGEP